MRKFKKFLSYMLIGISAGTSAMLSVLIVDKIINEIGGFIYSTKRQNN